MSHFKGKGEITAGTALSGKFTLRAATLGKTFPNLSHKDEELKAYFREKFEELGG